MKKYQDYAVNRTIELLNIDSPTGYTLKVAQFVKKEFEKQGFKVTITNKGNIFVDLGGKGEGIYMAAHVDTLGGMVKELKDDGRIKITNLGGMNANNGECENVKIYTRNHKVYEGTFQLVNASIHVNDEYSKTERNFDTCEVVVDEDVNSKEDLKSLGIDVGDIVAFETRTRVTNSGYIKSRFLDDKLSVGILMGLGKYIADKKPKLNKHLYFDITVQEEVGFGGSDKFLDGATELICVDMGCVGKGLNCTEKQASICVKDSRGPYNYEIVDKLVKAAKKEKANYALDVYPHYGSDADAALSAGNDVKHAVIGAGVYASHGYERSHVEGVLNTLKILKGYLEI